MSTKRSYSAEEKRNAVDIYLQGKMSQQELAERYGTGKATIRNWLRLYQTFGMEGLSQQKQTTRYSPELKLSTVKAYLSGQGSLRELCHRYGIRSDRQLRNWIRKYNRHQESSTATPCSQHRQKGKLLMSRGRKTTFEERVAILLSAIALSMSVTISVLSKSMASAMNRSIPGYASTRAAAPMRSSTDAARENRSRHGKN